MMRTPFLLLLAITAATPALALGDKPRDRDNGQQHKHHDGDQQPDRGGRPGGARPMPVAQGQPPRAPDALHGDGGHRDGHHDGSQPDAGRPDRGPGNAGIVRPNTPNGGRPDRGPGNWNGNGSDHGPGSWSGNRPNRVPGGDGRPGNWNGRPDRGPGGWNGRPGDGHDGRPGWNGHRPPPPGGGWDRGRSNGGWDRGWRGDRRYDWQRFRTFNRDRFRVGIYYAPGGYSYRPWYAGTRVNPYYYDRRYWLEDPSYFSLPYPPPGCAWVRYFNDVALIEIDDGAVLDVIPNFFF